MFRQVNFNHKILIVITEKDEPNDIRGASKAQSKSISSQPLDASAAALRSDHLVKLNLDIGSMVEVSSLSLYI